ncbi:MASE1 domain-containing protein [Terasakiella pusilla]|uniref:MASE1 domain-containing protein n=2 Tax=Terasakiella pusilla TaxID=64973 RepID=UPI003AA7C6AE
MTLTHHHKPGFKKSLVLIAVLAGLYFVTGKIGLTLSMAHANVTLIWPPTGISLAFMLMYGYRMGIGAAIGAFLVNITTDIGLAAVFGITFGNTMMAVSACYFLRQNQFQPNFSRLQDVSTLLFLGAFCGALVSAGIGTSTLVLTNTIPTTIYSSVLLDWWLGDAIGVMIAGPFTLLVLYNISQPHENSLKEFLRSLNSELLALTCGLLIFGGWTQMTGPFSVLLVAPLPVIIWSAYRFGAMGVATGVLGLSSIALIGTSQGGGPFDMENTHFSFILFFAYITVHSVIGLLIAASLYERKDLRGKIAGLEERLAYLSHSMPDIIILLDENDYCLNAYSDNAHVLDGIKQEPLTQFLDPERNREALRAIRYAKTSGAVQNVEATFTWRGQDLKSNLRVSRIHDVGGQTRTVLLFRQ